MKSIIILTIIAGVCFIYLLIKAIIDGIEAEPIDGTIIKYPDPDGRITIDQLMPEGPPEDEEVFQENDYIDEFSPENINLDRTLKIHNLRKKLHKIEEQRNINENK